MFPLGRPYRRALATLAMFVTTMVPTGYVALTAWRIHRPGHLRDVEVEIGRQLGLQVALEGVRYPRPGEVLYRGIVLRQEEGGSKRLTELARARELRLSRGDHELTVAAEGLRLRGESPREAMAQVMALLQRSGESPFDRVTLTAPACTLDLGQERLQFELRELAGTLQADPLRPTVVVSYRLPANDAGTRCELSLTRDRTREAIQTTLVMKTVEGLPLPARVLDLFFPAADWLGPAARVDGGLTLRQTGARDWEADFQGNLTDVDLNTLVSRRFPSHRLAGRARVALRSARWADRPGQGYGWVEVQGDLTTGAGTISVGLLDALASEMKFRLSPKLARLAPRRGALNYQALGLSFAMTPDGEIHFDGGLGNEFDPGVVLASQSAPLVSAPQGAANVRGLIRALFPTPAAEAGVLVPLTPESQVLHFLPVPSDGVTREPGPMPSTNKRPRP